MKRTILFFAACFFAGSVCVAQEVLQDPEIRDEDSVVQLVATEDLPDAGSEADSAVSVPNMDVLRDLERECKEWASDKFASDKLASFVQQGEWGFDKDYWPDSKVMCDVGTALYEDALRNEAMRDHPDWPIWAVDLALDDARDSYLRNLLFAR